MLLMLCEGSITATYLATASLNRKGGKKKTPRQTTQSILRLFVIISRIRLDEHPKKGCLGRQGSKSWRKRARGDGREEREPKEFEGVEKEGEGGSSAGLCGWLHAPVLLGGRGWLNKQS